MQDSTDNDLCFVTRKKKNENGVAIVPARKRTPARSRLQSGTLSLMDEINADSDDPSIGTTAGAPASASASSLPALSSSNPNLAPLMLQTHVTKLDAAVDSLRQRCELLEQSNQVLLFD